MAIWRHSKWDGYYHAMDNKPLWPDWELGEPILNYEGYWDQFTFLGGPLEVLPVHEAPVLFEKLAREIEELKAEITGLKRLLG